MATVATTHPGLLHTLFVEPICQGMENFNAAVTKKRVYWLDMDCDEIVQEINVWQGIIHSAIGGILIIPLINAIALAILKAINSHCVFPQAENVSISECFHKIVSPPLTRTFLMQSVDSYLTRLDLSQFGYRIQADPVGQLTVSSLPRITLTIQGWFGELVEEERSADRFIERESVIFSETNLNGTVSYEDEDFIQIADVKRRFFENLRRQMLYNRSPDDFTLQVCLRTESSGRPPIYAIEKCFVGPGRVDNCFHENARRGPCT